MRLTHLLATSCSLAVLTGCAATAARTAAVSAPAGSTQAAAPCPPWAHQQSDITPDPAFRYGCLPNGMRYVLRHNQTPPNTAAVHLRIDAGSLMERDDQLGLAHFMEHMVFNGTRNVPEGEFVRRLERLGLAFGADTNASTSFDETIYSLNLPDMRPEVVDTALLLMREAAGEALLEPEAIDRERGVVLSEERTREGPGLRMGRAQLDFIFKGQLIPRRLPIGSTQIIQNAQRDRFVEFYEAYYRPENAVLVAVGDFDVDEMERKIRERFSDWRGEGPPGARPNIGPIAERGLAARTYVEPGVPSSVTMVWNQPPDLDPDSVAERREEIREQLLLQILNRRLSRVLLGAAPPFTQAQASHSTSFDTVTQTALGAAFKPGEWRPALERLEQEQRRLVQHGVSQAEIEREVLGSREAYRSGVASAATRSSGALASTILAAVKQRDVVTEPAYRAAQFEEAVRGLTPEELNAIARRLFTGQGPLIFLTSPEPVGATDAQVAQAVEASRQVAVAPLPAVASKPWDYTQFGTPGRVAERREIADLGTTFIRFHNGVRLTVRPSQTQRNSILVSARAGDGRLDWPRNTNFSWAARAALVEGGLGRLTLEEISDALAGKHHGANVDVEDDAFVLSGSTRPADLDTQMQVLAAFMTDPAWRSLGLERARTGIIDQLRQARSTPTGALGLSLPGLLRSGDGRFAVPSEETIRATTASDVRTALAPLSTEPIEIVMTGDLTVDEAIRATAATFGALPPRRETGFPPASARTPFPSATGTPVRLFHTGRADQAMAFLAWPTSDFPSDPQKARAVRALQAVLRLRLTDEIRERQAVTYSPSVNSSASWAFPGYGYLAAAIVAPPDRLEPFIRDTFKIAGDLRNTRVTADELNRAVGPIIESIQSDRESNGYWSGRLAGAQSDPRKLEAIRQDLTAFQRVTPVDIQRVAQEYLRDDRAYRVLVLPETK